MKENLKQFYTYLEKMERLQNASSIINFDLMTVCPKNGYEYESETQNMLSTMIYDISKDDKYIELLCELNKEKDKLDIYQNRLIEKNFREYNNFKNVSSELYSEQLKSYSDSYSLWIEAREKNDYSIFAPALKKNVEITKKVLSLRPEFNGNYYDTLIDNFEEGFDKKDYDAFFDELKKHLIPLIKKVYSSPKKIRTDFLFRKVSISKQEVFSKYLMSLIGFDNDCGMLSTSVHPFTSTLARYDTRITTHYYEDNFISNMYSIIHEGGHAIFGQNEPQEIYDNHLQNSMTMAMHESVSRFYENRLGRSKEFIHFIYPKIMELFSEELGDVSEEELYLGINAVMKQPLRTEADELSYCLHIIIRYELEKEFVDTDNFDFLSLEKRWNALYKEYLDIEPKNSVEGILQDVHWTDTYGYFPTYAIGNAYNAMYLEKMKKEIPVSELLKKGDFLTIKDWMKEHVFKKASLLPPKDWIRNITGEDLNPKYFIEYLEEKYKEIYDL